MPWFRFFHDKDHKLPWFSPHGQNITAPCLNPKAFLRILWIFQHSLIWPLDSRAFVDLGTTGGHLTAKPSVFQAKAPHLQEKVNGGHWRRIQEVARIRSSLAKQDNNHLLLPSSHGSHTPHCLHILPWTPSCDHLCPQFYLLHHLLLHLLHHPILLHQMSSTIDPPPLWGVHGPPDRLSSATQRRLVSRKGKKKWLDKVTRGKREGTGKSLGSTWVKLVTNWLVGGVNPLILK